MGYVYAPRPQHMKLSTAVGLLICIAIARAQYAELIDYDDDDTDCNIVPQGYIYVSSSSSGTCSAVSSSTSESAKVSTSQIQYFSASDCSGTAQSTFTASSCFSSMKVSSLDTALGAANSTVNYLVETRYVNTGTTASAACTGTPSAYSYTYLDVCVQDGDSGSASRKTEWNAANNSLTKTTYTDGACTTGASVTYGYDSDKYGSITNTSESTCYYTANSGVQTKPLPYSQTAKILTYAAPTSAPTVAPGTPTSAPTGAPTNSTSGASSTAAAGLLGLGAALVALWHA